MERRFVALAMALSALFGLPALVAATVSGGCSVIGTSTSGGSVDLTANPVWHVRSTDQISIAASAPFVQTDGTASIYAFGAAIPVSSGHSEGETSYHSDSFDVATLSLLSRILVLGGASSGPFHTCAGQVTIVVDDVNPLLTLAGGGGLAAAVLALAVAGWSLRRPNSGQRRLIGLVGMAVFGGAASLVLQQTSTPGGASGPGQSAFIAAIPGPGAVAIDATTLLQSAVLSVLLVLLMPFPSELFNRTLEANLDEIRAAIARLPLLGRLARVRASGGGAAVEGENRRGDAGRLLAVAAFVLVSGLLYGFLDPAFGPDARSMVTYLGIVIAMVAVTLVAALPKRALHRQMVGDPGRLRAVPGTLAVAAACVLISRIAGFLPGYLYGLILGYHFARPLDESRNARAISAGAWWMLGLSLVAWFSLGAVRGPGIEPSIAASIAQSIFGAFVVAGIEGLVFGLIPLRFLAGEPVFRWERLRWAALYGLGLFGFFWIILDPAHGFVRATKPTALPTALALFVGFGLASVLFWAYFRFRPARAAVGSG